MTTDFALIGLKQLIEGVDVNTRPSLGGINIYTSTGDAVKSYPCITIEDTGSVEHEVLRGVFDPLTVEIKIHSIPNDSSSDGTIQDDHRIMSHSLYNLLADTLAITRLNDFTGLKVFDIQGIEVSNDRDDGRNVTTINMDIVCCQQTTNFNQ